MHMGTRIQAYLRQNNTLNKYVRDSSEDPNRRESIIDNYLTSRQLKRIHKKSKRGNY